ncbi:MAG: tetratricopeptide repeat protein [Rhodothermales bacterium]|nr:tetratricopeptide repeat protein [Rhodothermales bacterium]
MIRALLLASLFVVFDAPQPALCQTSNVLQQFDEANALYREGRYRDAADVYQLTIDEGFESAALHYNLGNSFYRLDELGYAILHYERALEIEPDNAAVQHSITLARSQTLDQFSRVPDPFWKPVISKLARIARAGTYFWIGFGLYLISATIVCLRILRRLSTDWSRRLSAVLAGVGAALIVVAFVVSVYNASFVRYIFVGMDTPVLTEPDELADVEVRIHEGLVFTYLGEEDGWVNIRLPNGVSGWIVDKDLVQI